MYPRCKQQQQLIGVTISLRYCHVRDTQPHIWFRSLGNPVAMSFLREELQRYDGSTSARTFASHVRRYRVFIDAEQPEKHSEADWLAS
jgi:hypothetical protein